MRASRRLPNLLLAVFLSTGLALSTGACASSGGSGSSGGSSTLITRAQVDETGASTAMEAIRQLRSRWLQRRGSMSIQDPTPPGPVVYVDGQRFGEVGSLTQVSARIIEEMRYINARDATTRYGTGHAGGVILITTLR